MIRSRWFAGTCGALLALTHFSSGAAQNQQPQQQNGAVRPATSNGSEPTFRTGANLVLVDVVVRDKGQAVQGLKESSFHILEDGHEQKLTVFEEHKSTDAMEASEPPKLPPHVYSDLPQYRTTSAANVLLLDALNTPMDDQKYVREQMLKYLHNIPAGTQVAVFTLASQLRMVSGFTVNAAAIQAALSQAHAPVQQSPLVHPEDDVAESQVEAMIAGQQGTGGDAMQMMENTRAFEQDRQSFRTQDQAAITIAALDALGRYLSPIPGRKNLIWFSGSFPIDFAEDLQPREGLPYQDYTQQLRAMEAGLARARVAVYPVDARTLMTLRNANVANIVPRPEMGIGADTAAAATDAQDDDIRAPQEWNTEQVTMEHMAEATGGEAFVNTNDVGRAIEKAIANGSNYYTLGYVPPDPKEDGAYHTIAVQMDDGKAGSKYQLAYRRGYYAADPNQPGSTVKVSPMTAAMEDGAPPSSQLIFEVRPLAVGDPELRGAQPTPGPAGKSPAPLKPPVTRYVVEYSIDPHRVSWKNLPDGQQQAELEVAQALFSAAGKLVNSTDAGLEVTLTAAQVAAAMREGVRVQQQIDLPAEEVSLRIGVRDVSSGRIGTVEIPLEGETKQVAARR